MLTTFSDVPIEEFLANNEQPTMLIKRGLRSKWVVVDGSLLPPAVPDLFEVVQGPLVRVPLMSYLVLDDPTRLFPFAVELGVRALSLSPTDVEHMHIAVGTPALDAQCGAQSAKRVFLGVAFKLRESR